jgi:hypothetical protein
VSEHARHRPAFPNAGRAIGARDDVSLRPQVERPEFYDKWYDPAPSTFEEGAGP